MINKFYSKLVINKNRASLLNSLHHQRNYASSAPASALNASLLESIRSIFGSDNLSVSESVRHHHSKDESLHP
jgi:hypothetical protein